MGFTSRRAAFAWASLGLVACLGCTQRQSPYSFRAPLLAGVAAEPLTPPTAQQPRVRSMAAAETPGPAVHRRPAGQRTLSPELLLDPGNSLVAHLRSLVGVRDKTMTSAHFAVATLRGLRRSVDADLAGTHQAEDLIRLIGARGAWLPEGERPALGDLAVFRDTDAEGGALIAVVVRVDRRGVIEFIALQRGVIRRGFADPSRPGVKRDDDGRVVNTHVRPGRPGDAKGSAYLAGKLWQGAARLGTRP